MSNIIRASDITNNNSVNVESIKINEFVSPKKLSDQIESAKEEYEELRKKIEDLHTKDGYAEGRNRGYEEGYNEGQDKGYNDGFQQGLQDGVNKIFEEEGAVLRLFSQFIEQLRAKENKYIQQNDQVIVDLIVEITKTILEAEAHTKPEVILQITTRAIEKLSYCPNVILHINPRDFETLEQNREKMEKILSGVSNLKIEENPSIAPGSCKLETLSGIIDADFISQMDVVKKLLLESISEETN